MVMVCTTVDVYTCVMVVVESTSPVTVMVVGGPLGKCGVTSGPDPVPLGPVPPGMVCDPLGSTPVPLGWGTTPVPAGLVDELWPFCEAEPVPWEGCGIMPVPEVCV